MNTQSFSVDFRSGIPVYIQIVEQVQALIARGELLPGDQLPTVRQLASELRVNFNTIARAYRMLDEAGLISTQQGRGTYIMEPLNGERSKFLKTRSLEDQIVGFIESLQQQGYQPDEVVSAINKV
ncbi:MAG: GntR family transcriptional regulator, partial [Anaerolineaceae bacterium]|nr:GntR family transcriptional regulator [Anaerolineaceae bacterium]